MALFYCDAQREDVLLAPIRSARTYYINLASGFNLPLYVHVGGANSGDPKVNALAQLGDYGWRLRNDIDSMSANYPTFVRDYNRLPGKEVATEHTMTSSTEKLWAVGVKRGWTNMSPELTINRKTIASSDWADGYEGWSFVDPTPGTGAQTVSNEFWSGHPIYDVTWTYSPTLNAYLRSNGGEKHTDLNNGQQLTFTNVVVMFAKEAGPLDEEKHMMYEVIGTGAGLLFAQGQAQEIKWEKKTRESELSFTDKAGKALALPRGKVWVSVLPIGNQVTY
jgi:hypothetical protein